MPLRGNLLCFTEILAAIIKLLFLGYMTLYEFITLPEVEQAEVTWRGEFLMTRNEIGHTIPLYKVDCFYVEVYYNKFTNEIDGFSHFSSGAKLEPYFTHRMN